MSFIGLEQPSHSLAWPSRSLVPTLRDNFQLGTIVVAGAAAQALLTLCIGWLSILPAVVYLAYRLSITYAIKTGLCSNPMLDGVQQTKYAAQFPDSNGEYGADAGRDAICVFVLGTRWNTPLGLFDPRVKEMGNFFGSMTDELHKNPDAYGFLGSTGFGGTERSANNVISSIMYFRDKQGVMDFAHGPLHRRSVARFTSYISKTHEIGLFHEMYQVPAHAWEAVYVDMQPIGLAATRFKVAREVDGEKKDMWMSPVVDATKGVLRTTAGRFGKA